MSRLNMVNEKTKSEKIIAHAVANVELFNSKPAAIKYYLDENKLFIKFEIVEAKGKLRTLKYFCYNEKELDEVTSALSSMYNIPVIEEIL